MLTFLKTDERKMFCVLLHFIFVFQICANSAIPTLPKCTSATDFLLNSVVIPGHLISNKMNTTFWFLEENLSCKKINHNVQIPLVQEKQENLEDEPIPSIAIFEPEGGVLKYNSEYFRRNEFCVEGKDDQYLSLDICEIPCDDPGGKICVPKCCAWGQALRFHGESEVDCNPIHSSLQWKPDLHHNSLKAEECLENDDRSGDCLHLGLKEDIFHYHKSFDPNCPEGSALDIFAYTDTPFAFLRNGSLLPLEFMLFNFSSYCIDGLTDEYHKRLDTHGALICGPICNVDRWMEYKENIGWIYVAAMLVSAFFLVLTVVVYILIWEKHNIHGWTVFTLSVSMGLMLIFLATARLIPLTLDKNDLSRSAGCVFVGIITHLLFLSTFCLLTCLSFDLWWTFRTLKPSTGKSKGVMRFKLYLLFSCGLPFIIVFTGFIMDKIYDNPKRIRQKYIIPQYGVDTCYIKDKLAQGIYVYLPVAMLLLVNLGFFLATMYIMFQYHKNTQAARKNSAKQNQTFQLFAKLFMVMGVTWTVEVIEYLSVYNRPTHEANKCPIYHPPGFAWIFTDLFNIFQGIAIFIIFVCKKQVMVHLSRRHYVLRAILDRTVFQLQCCKLNQLDFETPSGKTNQSTISMKTFNQRAEVSSDTSTQ